MQSLANAVLAHPVCYSAFGSLLVLYYGIRSATNHWRALRTQNIELRRQGKPIWSDRQIIYTHCVHGVILNAGGVVAGLLALFAFLDLYVRIADDMGMDTGLGILMAFLVLVAFTGLTGILPEMLYKGPPFGK